MTKFMTALRFVGDLDDSLYADEFRRDVWNEASAVGVQLYFWVSMTAAAVLPWAAGVPGAWMTIGLLVAHSVIAWVVVTYARSRRVDASEDTSPRDPRVIFLLVLFAIAIAGAAVRLVNPDIMNGGFGAGLIAGGVAGFAGAAVATTRAKRQRALDELSVDDES